MFHFVRFVLTASLATAITGTAIGFPALESFEQPDLGQIDFIELPTGQILTTDVAAWEVLSGTVDLVSSSHPFSEANDGDQAIDLNGTSAGVFQTSFATVAGRGYQVSFAFSRNTFVPAASASFAVIGNEALADVIFESAASSPTFLQLVTGFVADSELTTLRFSSTTPGIAGIIIDSVQVVPEPNLIALLGLTLAAWIWRGRAHRV